ncbi:MAG: O-antigen ligase family protein [Proteobacteria bacterium]|nr:O-antigen ligase family protein [Pseudomonadota bacterium]
MPLFVGIACSPIPFGSNIDWAWSPLAVIAGITLVLSGMLQLRGNKGFFTFTPSLLVAGGCFVAVLAWQLLRLANLGPTAEVTSLFEPAGGPLGGPIAARNLIDEERTWTALMRLATYGAAFFLVTQFARDRKLAQRLMLAIVLVAVGVTLYGLVMEFTVQSCLVLDFAKIPLEGRRNPCAFSGTFVASANYCDYAAMAGFICLFRLEEVVAEAGAHGSWRTRLRGRLAAVSGRGAFLLTALLILTTGVVLTASKAGIASFVVAAGATSLLVSTFRNEGKSARLVRLLAICTALLFAILIGGEHILVRSVDLLAKGDPARAAVLDLTAGAVALQPWSGWGLDSFYRLYTVLQPPGVALIFDKAHNSYLETALDVGIPMAVLIVAGMVAIAGRSLRGLSERRRDWHFSASAVAATILLGLHSLVDFGIQIPAVALTYAAVMGMGWAQSWSSRNSA